MQQATAPNAGTTELVVCRYAAQPGVPINPAPPRYTNDAQSSPWSIAECKWVGGCVVVIWVRLTLSPLQPQAMLDPIPALPAPPPGTTPVVYVDNSGPAPVASSSPAAPDAAPDEHLQSSRLQPSNVTAGPPVGVVGAVPALGLPAIAALPHYYHLPSYARPREPLPDQRNVTVRGGVMPVQPAAAPAYQPVQPVTQHTPSPGVTVAGSGLLASAEVRPFGGPLPPSPLDLLPPQPPRESGIDTMLGAVPPVPASITPARPIAPAPRNLPQAANAAVAQRGATDPSGYSETTQTAPPRLVAPPAVPMMSPVDRAAHPLPVPTIAEPQRAAPSVLDTSRVMERVLKARDSNDPDTIRTEAELLETEGWAELAAQLRTSNSTTAPLSP